MHTEIEAKWLGIDPDRLRTRLEEIGAYCATPERLMIRRNFDYPDKRLEQIGGWVRVRDEGDKVTLSYKQLNDRTLHGTKEVSLIVDDFEATCDFLTSIGLVHNSYQETKRESWRLGDVEIEFDTWPWIPTFVEIEAPDETRLRATAGMLGLDFTHALHGSVEVAYQAEYDVTELEIDNWPEIRFSEVPSWLSSKRKLRAS